MEPAQTAASGHFLVLFKGKLATLFLLRMFAFEALRDKGVSNLFPYLEFPNEEKKGCVV